MGTVRFAARSVRLTVYNTRTVTMQNTRMVTSMSAVQTGSAIELRVDQGIAWLTMNRPERLNAIDHDMRDDLLAAIEEIRTDPAIRVAVVTGAGRAFCSGADLSQDDHFQVAPESRRGDGSTMAREDGRKFGWWRVIKAVWENEKPFVAAVNGPAYGFGCNFALACDYIVAAEDAWFCEVFVTRGLPLEALGAYLLTRALPPARAKAMGLLGEAVSGAEAERWGLANQCVPAADLLSVAGDVAARFADGPSIGIGHIKGQINDAYEATFEQAWKMEVTLLGLGSGGESAEAFSAYAGKRAPNFRGM